jgi:hypothetical protein
VAVICLICCESFPQDSKGARRVHESPVIPNDLPNPDSNDFQTWAVIMDSAQWYHYNYSAVFGWYVLYLGCTRNTSVLRQKSTRCNSIVQIIGRLDDWTYHPWFSNASRIPSSYRTSKSVVDAYRFPCTCEVAVRTAPSIFHGILSRKRSDRSATQATKLSPTLTGNTARTMIT